MAGVIMPNNKNFKQVISDEDKLWLEGYSKIQKISVAAAIHQGIRLLEKRYRQETYQHLVERTSGLWKKGNGLAYQQKMCDEWE